MPSNTPVTQQEGRVHNRIAIVTKFVLQNLFLLQNDFFYHIAQ